MVSTDPFLYIVEILDAGFSRSLSQAFESVVDMAMPFGAVKMYANRLSEEQQRYTHLMMALTTALAVAPYAWARYLARWEQIPHDFWYQIPQASHDRSIGVDKAASGRNVARVFEDRVGHPKKKPICC